MIGRGIGYGIALAAGAIMLGGAAPGQEYEQEGTALPGWMAGDWCTAGPADNRTCEHWSRPAGGMMLGASHELRQGSTRSFEYMRIVMENGVPVFSAQLNGRPPTAFKGAADGAGIRFVNEGHDYPQQVRYWREGDELVAEIALKDGTKPNRWRFVRQPR
ncbi:DUF6265 family protein [Sphingomonas sp. HF-S3]|uniref:DUF6265 family protein n=1 Tax=Sphingomonas rustica TaxID=3103142 RepID=A0ABV0BBH7_9SPHN